MPSSLAFPDKLPLPLLSRHRLSADLLALLYLHAVDEHAEVLADRDQRRVLIVNLHAQRAVELGRASCSRSGQISVDAVSFDDKDPRHHDLHVPAVLALLGPRDGLVALSHDI